MRSKGQSSVWSFLNSFTASSSTSYEEHPILTFLWFLIFVESDELIYEPDEYNDKVLDAQRKKVWLGVGNQVEQVSA